MRKSNLLLVLLFAASTSFAQIEVLNNGRVGIGTTNPITLLDVRGDVHIPSGRSYWIGSNTDSGNRLRLHQVTNASTNAAFIDYFPALHFRAGTTRVLTMDNNGNVGIGVGTNNPVSRLALGAVGDAIHDVWFETNHIGLRVRNHGHVPQSIANTWGMAIHATTPVSSFNGDVGIRGSVSHPTPHNRGRAMGIMGDAGNATSGWNWGVIGSLTGTNNGAGILGVSEGNPWGIHIPGRYAGFFSGNVRVTGRINAVLVGNSDLRYKQNIVGLGEFSTSQMSRETSTATHGNVLSAVLALNPVQYNLRQVYFEAVSDTTTVARGFFAEESQLFQRTHFGLIAQELQEIFPNLVYEEDNGFLSINYTGLIPLLIQSIQELHAKVEHLQASIIGIPGIPAPPPIQTMSAPAPASNDDWTSFDETASNRTATLFQNVPNPFRQETRIEFYLPQTVTTAFLIFYDLQGRQLHQVTLTQRGAGVESISGSQFAPGIYLYALIADGREVAVKRMIITE